MCVYIYIYTYLHMRTGRAAARLYSAGSSGCGALRALVASRGKSYGVCSFYFCLFRCTRECKQSMSVDAKRVVRMQIVTTRFSDSKHVCLMQAKRSAWILWNPLDGATSPGRTTFCENLCSQGGSY